MKNNDLSTHSGNAAKYCLIIAVPFFLSGCYTVLKQSSEYYSEFDQKSIAKDTVTQNVADETMQPQDDAADQYSKKDEEADDQATIVNNYYGSAWGGYRYPYSRWSLAFGYGYDPFYTSWYDWGYYPDYYYWGGCYYPTGFGGHYRPYYPYYDFTPITSVHRNFGGRYFVPKAIGPGYSGNTRVGIASSQRQYKSGNSATKTTRNNKTAVRTGKRQYRTGDHATGPTKKAKSGSSGGRNYRNDKSVTRAFENASRSQSGRTYSNSSNRSSSGSGGSNQSAPRSGGGGGRSYKK